jgi:3D (Asp-Asp-Asp) domain-containing protein
MSSAQQQLQQDGRPTKERLGAAVPVGRLLILACLVPILAMIVLGASRFDAIPAVDVDSSPPALSAGSNSGEAQEYGERLFSLATPSDTALTSAELESTAEAMPAGFRHVETRMMVVTAYCPCEKCCGKHAKGITASGKPVSYNGGKFVAADARLPFGTMVRLANYHEGVVVEVIDRGGAIKGDKLDVFFPTHARAREWGRQMVPVQILERIDTPPPDELIR